MYDKLKQLTRDKIDAAAAAMADAAKTLVGSMTALRSQEMPQLAELITRLCESLSPLIEDSSLSYDHVIRELQSRHCSLYVLPASQPKKEVCFTAMTFESLHAQALLMIPANFLHTHP